MIKLFNNISLFFIVLTLVACSGKPENAQKVDAKPGIYPDYVDVTIPDGIAPMNFCLLTEDSLHALPLYVEVSGSNGGSLVGEGESTDFDINEWHELVKKNIGGKLTFHVYAKHEDVWKEYKAFDMFVSKQPLEAWGLAYRRIAPGYEVYSKMGLYQRELASFDEFEIFENTRITGMCVNCHTANRTNPKQMLFHARGDYGATAMQIDGKCEMLNTRTDSTLGLCVYPYWHPKGRYVAFATNTTRQTFHTVDPKRIEVFDAASDLQVYDTKNHELLLNPLLKDSARWETFPAFSSDGRTLYFCSTSRNFVHPTGTRDVRYNIYSITFDDETGTFGDSLSVVYDAERDSLSATLPRPSYDGRYMMFSLCNYGTFPINHKEADLWLMDLKSGQSRPIDEVNSSYSESFHNWSADSRWFVFCSRRGDGLYSRLYLSSIDDQGRCTKPFLLPQRDPWRFYNESLFSYNAPDFTLTKVEFDAPAAAEALLSGERVRVKVRE